MTKEQIHQALRHLGRGFLNHPDVEQLAEKLAEVLAHECKSGHSAEMSGVVEPISIHIEPAKRARKKAE